MQSNRLPRAFLGLWWASGTVICFQSARTVWAAIPEADTSHGLHLMLLGAVETVAALLFLLPRTMRFGGAGLLLTFGVAFVAHVHAGQFPGQLLIYAAVVCFVGLHGPVALPTETNGGPDLGRRT